ncbi:MAG TPA: histidine kinase dimerization/phosphoacceptor domain -containing protein [Spirochaetota bacterium]
MPRKIHQSIFESAFEHAPIGMALCGIDGSFISVNKAFASMLGHTTEDFAGLTYQDITTSDKESTATHFLSQWLESTLPSHTVTKRFVTTFGTEIQAQLTATVVRDAISPDVFFSIQAIDISERTRSEEKLIRALEEKDILLKEIHHRVKNNFQVVTSLLNLQEGMIKDSQIADAFTDSRHRIRSMALIHERLYHADDTSKIGLKDYIESIISDLTSTLHTSCRDIDFSIEVGDIRLDIARAVPIGLIVNEAVTNSLKYAFKPPFTGRAQIKVDGSHHEGKLTITISDNGVGIGESVVIENPSTLGLYLMTMLTRQLKGKLSIQRAPGTTCSVSTIMPV